MKARNKGKSSGDKVYINRDAMARMVSEHTGYTQEVYKEIKKAEDEITLELISQGYSIKEHKLFRLDIETRAEKKNAYDGIHKRRYTSPEQKYIKLIPLKQLNKALDKLNNKDEK